MKIEEHLQKALAFERALARLDPLEDGELYAVFLMRAGTNRLNAALHALGATTADGATADRIGDLNHTYKPVMSAPPPEVLQEAFAELAFIENLRPEYVRGPAPLDRHVADRARAAHRRIVGDTEKVLAERIA